MHTLRLPSELTIHGAADLHRRMCDWAATGSDATAPWRVDASAVDEIDSAGVQLLVALARSATHAGHAVQLASPSGALQALVADLELGDVVRFEQTS